MLWLILLVSCALRTVADPAQCTHRGGPHYDRGGSTSQAALAALTMLGVHTSIGAMNDLLDQASDAGRAEKPLVSGEVSPREARVMVVVAATAGFAAASALSPTSAALAAAGATLGYLYNAGIKRTPISFLPFALGVAIIPAFAWSAAGAPLPAAIAALSLIALPGGVRSRYKMPWPIENLTKRLGRTVPWCGSAASGQSS